jgi:hypothetical protein
LQIQLRVLDRDYHSCVGDRLSFRAQAILPLYQIAGLTDEIMSATSARIGAVVFLEKDAQVGYKRLTEFNAPITGWIIDRFHELRKGSRPQVTWRLLVEQVRLMEKGTHLMYLSGLLARLRLVELWRAGRLYGGTCECGGVVFANSLIAVCAVCKDEAGLELRLNPQIIERISDETGSLGRDHNLLVADDVWQQLFGHMPGRVTESWLKEREDRLAFVRLTWVFLWLGSWSGGRLVLVDVLE